MGTPELLRDEACCSTPAPELGISSGVCFGGSHARGCPGLFSGEGPTCSAGDADLIPGSEDPLEEGSPPQHSCLENAMDTGAWWAAVQGVPKNQTRLKRLHTHTQSQTRLKQLHTHTHITVRHN